MGKLATDKEYTQYLSDNIILPMIHQYYTATIPMRPATGRSKFWICFQSNALRFVNTGINPHHSSGTNKKELFGYFQMMICPSSRFSCDVNKSPHQRTTVVQSKFKVQCSMFLIFIKNSHTYHPIFWRQTAKTNTTFLKTCLYNINNQYTINIALT